MNRLFIIGNATKDPEVRTTPSGKTVCSFTLAVNRKKKVEGQPEADYFRVSAWNELGDNCGKYIVKGKKVAVVGAVSVSTYTNSKGETKANLEVTASEVEFVSPREKDQSGMARVNPEDNPFEEVPY